MSGYQPFVISRNGVPGGPAEGQKRALGGSTKNRLQRVNSGGPEAARDRSASPWLKHVVGVSPIWTR